VLGGQVRLVFQSLDAFSKLAVLFCFSKVVMDADGPHKDVEIDPFGYSSFLFRDCGVGFDFPVGIIEVVPVEFVVFVAVLVLTVVQQSLEGLGR